jgi:hypothetical protein
MPRGGAEKNRTASSDSAEQKRPVILSAVMELQATERSRKTSNIRLSSPAQQPALVAAKSMRYLA